MTSFSRQPFPEPDFDAPMPLEPPLERYEELGFWSALWQTVVGFLKRSPKIFGEFRPDGYARPILYMVGLTTAAVLVNWFFQTVLMGFFLDSSFFMGLSSGMTWNDLLMVASGLGISLLTSVGMAVIGSFLLAGLLTVMLRLGKTPRSEFEKIYRLTAYVMGTAAIFSVIPYFGGLIGLVWQVFSLSIGLKVAQEISGRRAFGFVILAHLLVFFMILVPVFFISLA